jgi:tRNA threonylcarbamoyladenosine modification (KEOPS) complex  Pcc1 subunit
MTFKYRCQTSVEFDSPREAEIVFQTLSVDAELRPDDAARAMRLDGATVTVEFSAREPRMLRASVGTFYDLLGLAVRTLEAFRDTLVP